MSKHSFKQIGCFVGNPLLWLDSQPPNAQFFFRGKGTYFLGQVKISPPPNKKKSEYAPCLDQWGGDLVFFVYFFVHFDVRQSVRFSHNLHFCNWTAAKMQLFLLKCKLEIRAKKKVDHRLFFPHARININFVSFLILE